ncbi:ATP synthase subunit gamma, mitochondrial-like [Symsagittifera roscoffensis]|uniref:ATP synthase subunit gamma, mitochondrial-like n=1 Tax=Symsagittifera roscoffensis TaxID=84072 RepID=UPI00307B3306
MFGARSVLRQGLQAKNAPLMQSLQPCREMATLKDISLRLKSVKNILKITSSMKMIAAARFAKADKELKQSFTFGHGSQHFYDQAEVKPLDAVESKRPVKVLVALSSDRGLCGAIHSSIAKSIRNEINTNPGTDYKLVIVGDKARGQLQRTHAKNIFLTFKDVGKVMPSYGEASLIASEIIDKIGDFDMGHVYYNKFKSVVSYNLQTQPIFTVNTIAKAPGVAVYDSVDEFVLQNYQEASLTNMLYYAMKEASASEHSSRMTAMGNASKNAEEMIGKLTIKFNRTRQAVITTELSEIISGAVAIE